MTTFVAVSGFFHHQLSLGCISLAIVQIYQNDHQMVAFEQVPPRQQSRPRPSAWCFSPSSGPPAGDDKDEN